MSGNLKDYKEELEDFWESLPKKEYTQRQLTSYLKERMIAADKTERDL